MKAKEAIMRELGIKRRFILLQDDDPKHTAKANLRGITREDTQHLGMSMNRRPQAKDMQQNDYHLHNMTFIYITLLCPKHYGALKWGGGRNMYKYRCNF